MCHEPYFTRDRLEEDIASELLDEPDSSGAADEPDEDEPLPSFLNEERDTEVDILTDGGADE